MYEEKDSDELICILGRPQEMILSEKVGAKKNVALIKLNRPKALNALCDQLMTEVVLSIRRIL